MVKVVLWRSGFLLAVLLSAEGWADTVTLKSGASFSGLIVETNDEIVTLKRRRETERVFKQADVASIDFNKEETEEALLPPLPPPAPPVKVVTRAPPPDLPPSEPEVPNARVTLYGTSWCGYCAKARAYLNSRKIPFTDLNIERSPSARGDITRKCEAKGIKFTGGVPMLDVNGHIIQGFDLPAIKAALGDKKG